MIKIFARLGKAVGIIFLGCLSTFAKAQDSITLTIGDAAPPLQYAQWIKGGPDSLMNQDKLYVLEFWATWCSPCKAAMPHLSELAKKYEGKASVIGVNIWEKTGDQPYESSLPAVTRFVNAMGEKMAYNVIADNNSMDMANNWMIAAGQQGIPSTFLIKDKKIIWIGHPIILDSILNLVINNKYDITAAKKSMEAKTARSQEFTAKYKRLMNPINDALEASDYAKAFALMNEAIKQDPSLKLSLGITRFNTLLNKISEDSALSVGKQMIQENGNMGIYIATQIVEKDSLSKSSYAFAASELEKALKTEGMVVPIMYSYLASARAKMGDKAGAVKAQKQAISEAKKALKEDKWPGTILDYTVTDYEQTLKKYQRMKKGGITGTSTAQPAYSKMQLKVLFVGYDPAKPMPEGKHYYPGMMTKEAFVADYPVRMPAFKSLLNTYFTEVKTMDCREWKPSDSEPYDVTIFDFNPTELEESRTEKDANGKTKYIPASYLPEDFSRPVIFIASTADNMGRSLGLKLDWLCLCLDADAHHLNAKHAIFKGPLEQVVPTMEMKKTPEPIYHYTTGKHVPKELPMWKVQTIGYMEGKSCRIGLVSRGNRFAEGPDAEVISSGVCAKDVGAVALGRQGNFFLWGFGASPAQMTPEAKKVFVNVVAYMKQFNGKTPVTKKYNDRMATTDDIREIIANASTKSYQMYKETIDEFNESNKKKKNQIEDKKAAGIPLTTEEEESLQYIGREQPVSSWEEYLKGMMGSLASEFGSDAQAFQKYLTANFDYIYCDPNGFFSYWVDEEAQKIGVSNHSIKILDTCVQMLKRNQQPQLALNVLKRYTAENFSTAGEWSRWLSQNRSKLFFSETNGYRFMINTYN